MDFDSTGLVGPVFPLGLGVFSRASFAIQPSPRLRTLLDGAGRQAPRRVSCAKRCSRSSILLDPDFCGLEADEEILIPILATVVAQMTIVARPLAGTRTLNPQIRSLVRCPSRHAGNSLFVIV